MKPGRLLTLIAIATLFATTTAALPGPAGVVRATGTAHHTYVTDGTCEADAMFVVEYEVYFHRVHIFSDTPCVDAYFSIMTNCHGTAGTDVTCHREQPGLLIDVLLKVDGTFSFRWTTPTFDERIVGTLERADI